MNFLSTYLREQVFKANKTDIDFAMRFSTYLREQVFKAARRDHRGP
jgi:catalase